MRALSCLASARKATPSGARPVGSIGSVSETTRFGSAASSAAIASKSRLLSAV